MKPTQPSFCWLGSANWQLAGESLQERARSMLGEHWQELALPFGQYALQLHEPDSLLRQRDPQLCLFCERIEDLLGDAFAQYDDTMLPAVEARFAAYLERLQHARTVLTGTFMVFDLAPVRAFVQSLADTAYGGGLAALALRFSGELATLCARLPDCHVLPLSTALQRFGSQQARPGKYWQLGRFPFAPAFCDELATLVVSAWSVLRGRTARVLVLDLDNTLWGGVIGDDGLAGIQLGPDYPGNMHVALQQVARAWRQRGVVLALCSKNTEAVALEAIERHPGMVLRREDFLCWRINWQPKPDNLRALAEDIGVGLSALCFIDDSPYERAAVRQALPEVIVPELPDDPAEWADWLAELPCLAHFALTREDRERVERYQVRRELQQAEASFASREDYWRSLGMQLHVEPLAELNRQRVLQLLAKTNQFNTTTRRHGEADLIRLQQQGGRIWALGLADRYASREIIGVLIAVPEAGGALVIDSFVLSCRVLGRSVERAVLGWLARWARQAGHAVLVGCFLPTERNQPAASVYADHGFIATAEGRFELPLTTAPGDSLVPPDWFEVYDDA